MEQEHRTKILNNIDELIRSTNYGVLVRACLSQNLLSQLMVDKIQVSDFKSFGFFKNVLKIINFVVGFN